MATTEELQAQLAELNAAIAGPERQVTDGSQNVTYRSIDDLIKARNDLQARLDAATAVPGMPTGRQRRSFGVYGGRGFD